MRGPRLCLLLLGPPSGQHYVESCIFGGGPKFLKICSKIHFLSNSRCNAGPDFWLKLIQIEASSLLGVSLAPLCGQNSIALASWGVFGCFLHTSIRTSRLEGRRAGRCILRRRDSRCVVSERHRAGVLGLGCPMHGELARPASPHEVGEGALTAVCPPAGPNLPAAQ